VLWLAGSLPAKIESCLGRRVDGSSQPKDFSASAPSSGATMDALKQYRYKPATQGGKPVAAHVTVTIKFLFEP
jgi:hypothetical protein